MQAVYRQDEKSLPARTVDRVVKIRSQENLILDVDRLQFARPYTHQGIPRSRGVVLLDLPLACYCQPDRVFRCEFMGSPGPSFLAVKRL